MADFRPIRAETSKNEGGYQKYENDPANFCDGLLIGTKGGISAIAYKSHYGYCPTVQQLISLTEKDIENIYRKNYWNKIQGDKIKDQSVARILFGMYIGSPGVTISILKKVLSESFNKTVNVSSQFSTELISVINKLNGKKLFEALKVEKMNRINQSSNTMFIKGWLGKYEKMSYEKSYNKALIISSISIFILACLSIYLYKKKEIKIAGKQLVFRK